VRLLTTVLVLSTLSAAWAEDYDKLYAEGVELRRRHQDREAMERFQRAHTMRPSPRTQAQIGFAEQALGRWAEAERDLKAALGAPDPWIEKNRPTIERALATTNEHLGTLEIAGSPPGAEIRVEGSVVGRLPLPEPLRVVPGATTVELRAEGYVPGLRSVPIEAQKLHRTRIDLVRIEVTRAPVDQPRPHDRRLWLSGWSLLGAGAGLLVVGVAGIGVREGAAADWNSSMCTGGGLTRIELCSGTLDRVSLGENLAISGFVAGGALVVAGVTLLALDARRRAR
jgi:hypothetical protein